MNAITAWLLFVPIASSDAQSALCIMARQVRAYFSSESANASATTRRSRRTVAPVPVEFQAVVTIELSRLEGRPLACPASRIAVKRQTRSVSSHHAAPGAPASFC